MTATFVFVQPDRVVLLNDAAVLDADGNLVDVGSKLAVFPEWNMVIAYQGYCHPRWIEQRIRKTQPAHALDAVSAVPGVLRDLADLNRRSARSDPKLRFLVAAHSDQDGPAAWMAFSRYEGMPANYRPGQLVRIRSYHDAVHDVAETLGRNADPNDPRTFDAATDGLTMMEAARRTPYEEGWYGVGGFVELATLGAAGIERSVLREWPEDIVGQKIQPSIAAQ